ncbi:MAG: hypothetical protein LKH43_09155 [Lactobacillus crispatus]|nr:hypothetical protein [Lactobacillus crispatus]MCI1531572.1 hypothetical protein [Lactobacillus amylovorus]
MLLCRKRAAAQPLSLIFTKVNQVIRGWINYFGIGTMNTLWINLVNGCGIRYGW